MEGNLSRNPDFYGQPENPEIPNYAEPASQAIAESSNENRPTDLTHSEAETREYQHPHSTQLPPLEPVISKSKETDLTEIVQQALEDSGSLAPEDIELEIGRIFKNNSPQ